VRQKYITFELKACINVHVIFSLNTYVKHLDD
jgi:hypothetical protein